MSPFRYVAALSATVALGGAAGGAAISRAVRAEPASLWEQLVIRSQPRAAAPAAADRVTGKAAVTVPAADSNGQAAAVPPLAAPRISRITITAAGVTRLEGSATPGSEISISSGGRDLASTIAETSGRWTARLPQALPAGDHDISSTARSGQRTAYGDELRLSIPAGRGVAITVEDGRMTATGSLAAPGEAEVVVTPEVKSRAEELAAEASRRFDELGIAPRPETGRTTRSAEAPTDKKAPGNAGQTPEPGGESPLAPVYNWLEHAARGYQSGIIDKLAVPKEGAAATASAPESRLGPSEPKPAPEGQAQRSAVSPSPVDGVRTWLEKANEAYQRQVVDRLSKPTGEPGPAVTEPAPAPVADTGPVIVKPATDAEQEARKTAERRAEAKKRAERQAEAYMEEKARIDEALRQTRARAAEEAKRSVESARMTEEQRRRAEQDAEIRAREEKRAAEAARLRLDQEKKLADAQRLLAERNARKEAAAAAKKALEEKRAADEKARAEALAAAAREAETDKLEEQRLEREAAERRRLLAEEQDAAERARRQAVASRKAEEAEVARRARQQRAAAESETQEEAAAEAERDVQKGQTAAEEETAPPIVLEDDAATAEEKVKPRGARLSSAERRKTAVKEARSKRSAARTKGWRKRAAQRAYANPGCQVRARCRGGRVHIVRQGETLWAIANRYYCTGLRYEAIYRANRRTVSDPDRIRPAMRIYIPRRGC